MAAQVEVTDTLTWRSGAELTDKAIDVEVRPGRTVKALQLPASEGQATVFFIHGSAATMSQYFPVISKLAAQGYGVLAFDLYGCGRSPKPDEWEAYSFRNHQLDVRALYDRFLVPLGPESVVVVGHSAGTHLAMKLSIEVGGTMKGLVLLGGALALPTGGHPIMRLPVFCLNWLQPSLSSSFRSIAFHPDCDPELMEAQEVSFM